MYNIFVCTNIDFGEWKVITENNRDVANVIAKGFISNTSSPVITVCENKYRVWNSKQTRQPEKVDISGYPKIKAAASTFEHVELYDHESLGCFELYCWNYNQKLGAKEVTQRFYNYRQDMLFETVGIK